MSSPSDRRLIAGLIVSALIAVGLIMLRSWTALVCASILGAVLAGAFAVWMSGDAKAWDYDVWVWCLAMLLWPLSLPPYLILTRGMRGLLLAAAVLFVFFLLPFSFLGAIVRQEYQAALIVERAQTLSWKKTSQSKKEALAMFRQAVEIDPNAWQAYMMVFVTAFELEKSDVADEYYTKLQVLHDGWWRKTASDGSVIGWYLTALTYQDFAQVVRLENATAALTNGDTRRLVEESREAYRHRKEVIALLKDWDRVESALGPVRLRKYSEDIKKLKTFIVYLRRESWKSEAAGRLADNIDSKESWRRAIESYGQGQLSGAASKSEQALAHYSDAAKHRTDFPEPDLMRAAILLDLKKFPPAARAARRAVVRMEKYGTTFSNITKSMQLSIGHSLEGLALIEMGRVRAARKALATARQLGPETDATRKLRAKIGRSRDG